MLNIDVDVNDNAYETISEGLLSDNESNDSESERVNENSEDVEHESENVSYIILSEPIRMR